MPRWKVVDTYEPIQPEFNAISEPTTQNKERKWRPVSTYNPEVSKEYSDLNPLRHIARSESRILETIGGFPKAGLNIAEGLYNLLPESLREAGLIQKALPGGQLIGSALSKAYDIGSSLLPSSENIREEVASRYPQGYTEPQNEYEQASDEFIQDLTSFLIPIGGSSMKATKALGTALGSNALGFATKKISGSEKLGNAVKIGTVLLSNLKGFTPPDLEKEAEELYRSAERSIIPGERVSSRKILGLTEKIEKEFTKIGHEDIASKKKLQSFLNTIKKTGYEELPKEQPSRIISLTPSPIKPPIEAPATIDLRHLWQLKKDIPDTLERLEYGTQAYKHITQLRKEIDKVLKSGIDNKIFSQKLTEADQLYSSSMRIKEIKEEAAKALKSEGAKAALAYSFIQDPLKTAYRYILGRAVIGTPFKVEQAKEILNLIKNNPKIEKAYTGILEASVKDNIPLIKRYGIRLNQALEQEKKKNEKL